MSPHRVASRAHSAISVCLVLMLAGAAWFVLPATVGATVPDTGAVTDTVEDTLPGTDEVTDPVEEIVEETLPPTDEVTDPVEEIVEETLPDTGGVTQPIEGAVEETLPDTGGTTDPIDELTGSVKETVGSIEGGTLDEVTDSVTGPAVDSVDKTLTGTSTDSPDGNDGRKQSGRGGSGNDGSLAQRFPHEFSGAGGSAGNPGRVLAIAPVSTPAPSDPGLIERVAQAALNAAKRIAFPLVLALLAGAFIVAQGRIDRRDPKLAAAPIEVDEQLLRFE